MMDRIKDEEELRASYEKIWEFGELKEEPAYYRLILDLLETSPGRSLLDVACGGGYLLQEAEARNLETFGIDLSQNAIECARDRCARTEFKQGSGEALPYPDQRFDYVTCLGSLEHFVHPEKGLLEMRRVLKEDGKVCIVLPNQWFILDVLRGWINGDGLYHGQELERFYSLNEAKSLIKRGSLFIKKASGYCPLPSTFKYARPFRIMNNFFYFLYKLFYQHFPVSGAYVFALICTRDLPKAPSDLSMGSSHEDFFLEGWYPPEHSSTGKVFRWTCERASVALFLPPDSSEIVVHSWSLFEKFDLGSQTTCVRINGTLIGEIKFAGAEYQTTVLKIPSMFRNSIVKLELVVQKTFVPAQVLKNGDSRAVGIGVERIAARRA